MGKASNPFYSAEQKEDLRRNTPICEYLFSRYPETYPAGRHDEFRLKVSRGQNIPSPFRSEATGSFRINSISNEWVDYGCTDPRAIKPGNTHAGGDIFDLVKYMENCSFYKALDIVANFRNMEPQVARRTAPAAEQQPARPKDTFRVIGVSPLRWKRLTNYLIQERHLDPSDITSIYRQVTVGYFNPGEKEPYRKLWYVGFPRTAGAGEEDARQHWALFNDMDFNRKMTTGGGVTLISPAGTFVGTSGYVPKSGTVAVFEGSTDYASALKILGRHSMGYDVVVLNSVNMMGQALPYLLSHQRIATYLDNDAAGIAATEFLKKAVDERNAHDHTAIEFVDMTPRFATADGLAVNDLNEYLVRMEDAGMKFGRTEDRQQAASRIIVEDRTPASSASHSR